MQTKRQWITSFEAEEQSAAILGGKGLNLFRLKEQGLPVPEFGVVSTAAYDLWLQWGKVVPQDLIDEILATVKLWNASFVAVRSSMTSEDSASHSYAGMMESFLYVSPHEIAIMLGRCFESMSAARVQRYEKNTGQDSALQRAAVIIQKMVNSEVSGVAFSRAPMGDSALVQIEAGLGLGEGIVSGLVEVDSFSVDRFHTVVNRRVAPKKSAVRFDPLAEAAPRVRTLDVPPELSPKPALDSEQITQLTKVILDLERVHGYPVDIEWAFESPHEVSGPSKLYLLQIRPITQSFPPLVYYVDTNLSESYPGVTSTFTSTFVAVGYTRIFTEAFEYLGLSQERIAKLKPFLDHLVTNLGGHMYYNLRSYYSALISLPGGRHNIERWHHMIGGGIEQRGRCDAAPPLTRAESLRSYASLAKMYLFHGRIFGAFYRYTDQNRRALLDQLKSGKTSQDMARFMDYAVQSTRGFGLTGLNDFLIMILIKILMERLPKWGLSPTDLPRLVKTKEGVDSLAPLSDLRRLVHGLAERESFFAIFRQFIADHRHLEFEFERLYDRLFETLIEKGHTDAATAIAAYISKWGERSFEELKLESLTLRQSPALLLDLMLFMIKEEKSVTPGSGDADRSIDWSKLGFFSRILCRLLLFYTHQSIATREKTRLIRGQYFGLMREGMLRLIQTLKMESPPLFEAFTPRDFFEISFESVKNYGQGQLTPEDLAAEIVANRARIASNRVFPEAICLADGESAPSFPEDEALVPDQHAQVGDALKGLGASSGLVEGEVLCLEAPDQAFHVTDLSRKILVTRTTDPAWVFIMSQCSGLVSEKGSLLSHTAIIGREMGIPTVVGVSRAMTKLRTGDRIQLNGQTGAITVIARPDAFGQEGP